MQNSGFMKFRQNNNKYIGSNRCLRKFGDILERVEFRKSKLRIVHTSVEIHRFRAMLFSNLCCAAMLENKTIIYGYYMLVFISTSMHRITWILVL